MKRQLPLHPSLTQLRHQAKDLLKYIEAGSIEAMARMRDQSVNTPSNLSDAQLVIAREYGFASWPKLKHHVESLEILRARVTRLQAEFASGDTETKRRLLKPAHAVDRFENYDPHAPALSDADAHLLIANEEGYAFWSKYESYLNLDPAVQSVISASRTGDLKRLQEVLRNEPEAANPKWAPGFKTPQPIPNDSIPLFCVSEGVFRGANSRGNECEIASSLIAAGADWRIVGDLVLTGAVSFNAICVVEVLLDHGAPVDGVDGDGVPMAYALHFGFTGLAELLARRGAKLDLPFAAGLGKLDVVKDWFMPDGTLKPDAGALADPYGFELKTRGKSPFRCERSRPNILSQSLYYAVLHGRLDTALFLLKQGADINAIVPGMDFQATILHRIAGQGGAPPLADIPLIEFLLEHGARLDIRDKEYQGTPLNWALHGNRRDSVEYLKTYQVNE